MNVHSGLPANPSGGSYLGSSPVLPQTGASWGYSVEVVTTEEGLSSLAESWNRLSDVSAFPNVFMSFDWFRAWNQHFAREAPHGRRRLNVLALKRDGHVAGISPLIHRTAIRFGVAVRKVEFAESESSYNDLVWGSDPAGQIAAVLDFLAETEDQWDLVDLRSLSATGNALALIQGSLARTKLIYRILPEKPCPYVVIDAPWPVMLGRLSAHARHSLHNQQNRLKRMSAEGLCVRIIEDPHKEPGLLEKLIALESQKQVEGKRVNPFLARYPEVFQSLFSGLGPRGWIMVALMEKGDLPIAWTVVFRCGKKLWGYHRAFNADFSRLSPGIMLDTVLIGYGFSHGYDEYDFLYGNEPYKMRWNTGCHERFRLLIWSRGWTSRAKAFIYVYLKEAIYRLGGKTRRKSREVEPGCA